MVRSAVSTGAILFTDMVDSTALRSRLGEDRADMLRRQHDEMLAAAIELHRGSVLRWTGDGVKAGFETSSDAVAAAVAIHRAVVEYGASEHGLAAFQLRIGISAGELTVDETGDHRGLAVVEAARLEALCRPGETLITEVVRLLGGRRADVSFEDVGQRSLKGIEQPVTVFRVVDLEAGATVAMPRFLSTEHRLPLVGRNRCLDDFQRCWNDARLGTTGTVLVHGQAGIGKTRFVSTCADVAHRAGALVLGGACNSDLAVPYEPFAAALDTIRALDSSLSGAAEAGRGPLARLFPGADADSGERLPAAARADLFDAVAAVIQRLCTRAPLLLVLDDMHWADEPTVQMLRHLTRTIHGHRLLILATYRDGDLAATHPLRELLTDIRRFDAAATIELGALTEAEVAELVTAIKPTAPFARLAAAAELIHGESSGNPFFAAELLRHLDISGQLDDRMERDVGGRLSVPGSVQSVVLQRLAQQPEGTHELLSLAAVIGPAFDIDVLAAVGGRSADDLLDLLEDLARAGVVREVGIDRFGFAHAIVRNALLEEMSASRLARAHRKVAEALEAAGGDQFDELARHWRLAGDDSRGARYLAQSARRDMGALAYESARRGFQDVIEVLAGDPRADVAELAEAWLGLAGALRAIGDPTFTDAVMRTARLARAARTPHVLMQAAVISAWLGRMFHTAERPDQELIELCEDSLTVAAETDPLRVRILVTLASHLTFEPDRERRRRLIAEAKELAARHDDPLLSAAVLQAEFSCLWDPTTLERREQIARELGRLARATGDPQLEFVSGFFTSYCLVERGDLPAAHRRLVDLVPKAEETRNEYYCFLVERLLLTIDVARSAQGVQARVDGLLQKHRGMHMDAEPTWMLHTGLLALQAGTLGQMAGAMSAMTTGPQALMWSAAQALTLVHAGDRDAAAEVLDRPMDAPQNYFWLSAFLARAEAAAELGRLGDCRTMIEELTPYAGRIGVTGAGSGCIGLVSRVLGLLVLTVGDTDHALSVLTQAVGQADHAEFTFERVAARRLLGEALLSAGRPEEAASVLREGQRLAEHHGFAREIGAIAGLMARDVA